MEQWEQDIRTFIIDLSTIKNRAAKLHMWPTFYLIDDALNRAGWEFAEKLEKERN
jgi:hypothetical protein